MRKFQSFHGIVTMIEDFLINESGEGAGCYKLMTVQDGNGTIVNFVVSPDTYFVDQTMVAVGDMITGFYDAFVPTPMIYPPQFRAIVMAVDSQYRNVKVDYFDSNLLSSDKQLKLNIATYTSKILMNGQWFTVNPANRELIVIYGPTTMSIPAQTTPYKIIVMC